MEIMSVTMQNKSLTCEIETFSGQHEVRGYLLADKTFLVPKVFVQVDMIQPKIKEDTCEELLVVKVSMTFSNIKLPLYFFI